MSNISGIIKSIQDIMRKDAGTYGDAQRIEQLAWLFFLKILDDRELEAEALEDDYSSPMPKGLRWSDWAANDEGITGTILLDFVNNELLEKLKNLSGKTNGHLLIRTTFADANNYMKNGTLLRQVINKINTVDFNNSKDRHTFGDIYEQILRDLQSAGNAGEFYTPRAVTQLIVSRVNPTIGNTIMDPACGTGGFLTCAIDHLREQAKSAEDEATIQNSLRGIEKKHLPHILCMTNMLLHGMKAPNWVKHDNTLATPLREWKPTDRVDCIVSNPPFGGMEEDGIEKNFPSEFQTRETADLFLVLMMRLLKPNGRAGIVLPDGTLFGEGIKTKIKELLCKECNLHTIVRLPKSVFAPYTSIATNLLFFTKGTPTKDIWYYEHQVPEGVKNYNKTKPIDYLEFKTLEKWWGSEKDGFKKRKENEQAWKVSIDEIVERGYNLDIKNPHQKDVGSFDADELLLNYREQQGKISGLRDQLKDILGKALSESAGVKK